jgi:hypothetical protein
MQLDPKHFDIILASLLNSWTLNRIRIMTIEEYADLSDYDSLCYWLEYGTKDVGAIGIMSLGKFELWKPRKGEDKKFKDGRFKMEGFYAYKSQKSNTLKQAFNKIRKSIFDIVKHSLNQNWEAIEAIEFHTIIKWKLAFLFSSKRLLPVYSMRSLLAIARGLGHTFTSKYNILG